MIRIEEHIFTAPHFTQMFRIVVLDDVSRCTLERAIHGHFRFVSTL
jgi:hypothetical protein